MPAVDFDAEPVMVHWPVVRGDDATLPLQFAQKATGAYTVNADRTVTVHLPLDITGRTYSTSISVSRLGAVLTNPAATPVDTVTGELTLSLTATQTSALRGRYYWFDLIENPGTTERTLIVGRIEMIARVTP